MTLEKLKEYADEKNITIIDGALKNKKAFAFADDEQKAIVMDNSKIADFEQKEILGEEIGHCEMDSLCFAFLYTSPIFRLLISKAEHEAKAWAFKALTPICTLKDKILNGYTTAQLSEFFGVTHRFILQAISYYQSKNLLSERGAYAYC